MDTPSPNEVAARWIEKWAAPGGPSGESDGYDLDWELPRDNPRLCWDSILEVLSRIPCTSEDRHFQALAAGPLEDLLIHHGPSYVDEIDVMARRSPEFRLLLNGVWARRVNQDVLDRLTKYMNARW
jgi:hypothetical protein